MPANMIQAMAAMRARQGEPISGAVRLDSWQNQVTGFGTALDKTTYTTYVGSPLLSDEQLSNLYHGDDLAARMVDIVPDEMMRKGVDVDVGDTKLNTELGDHLEAIALEANFADGWRWGRCFGGAAILLGADDGRPAHLPLKPERAKSLAYLHVLDRRYLWPMTYYREPGPKMGRPETYLVAPSSAYVDQGFARVHESRLVLFGGATTAAREREANNTWDLSVLQRAFEALRSFNTGFQSAEQLLTDAHQAVFKMQGLAEAITAQGEEAIRTRIELLNRFRSNIRALVVDAGDPSGGAGAEEFERQSVSFTDIPNMLDRLQLRLAASVMIPVTILMGQSPAGMNATGESDFRWFYDRIASEQTRKATPAIRRIVKVALATKQFAATAKTVEIKFPPLWTEPPSAVAQTRKALLDGDAVAINAGMLLPEEAALSRFRPDGFAQEIKLTPQAEKAREEALGAELERMQEPEDVTELGPDGSPPPGSPPAPPGSPEDVQRRARELAEDDSLRVDRNDK